MVAPLPRQAANEVFQPGIAVSGPPQRRFGNCRVDSSSCHQPPSDPEQVAEREQREEVGAVLGEAATAGPHVAELALDEAERMLDACSDHRDGAVYLFVERMQRAAFRGLAQLKRQANDPGDRL